MSFIVCPQSVKVTLGIYISFYVYISIYLYRIVDAQPGSVCHLACRDAMISSQDSGRTVFFSYAQFCRVTSPRLVTLIFVIYIHLIIRNL